MKKILSLLLILALSVSGALLISCGEHEHSYKDWTQDETHHYKVCTVKGCEEKSFYEEHIFSGGICAVCRFIEPTERTVTPENVSSVLAYLRNDVVVNLTPGIYSTASLVSKNNVTLKGQDGVIFEDNIKLMGECSNIVIENITFNKPVPQVYDSDLEGGGVRILDDVDGLTIKNCTFTNFSHLTVALSDAFDKERGLQNLTLDNCSFIELSNGESLSSLYIGCTVQNVTINNCSFVDIEYNAVQLSGLVKGNVNFTNSTYKNIGSRYFNVNNAPNVNWNISYNKFYSATTSAQGQYFKGSNMNGTTFTIGVNYWEQIPTLDTEYFAIYDSVNSTSTNNIFLIDGITYNELEQLSIEE